MTIELSNDEAIVLFELLNRVNESQPEGIFEDQAERRVWWSLESELEKQLTEPFASNWNELLLDARKRLRE